MNEEMAIERITETENLTDGLEDPDANWLLNWGIGYVRDLIGGIEDDERAGAKINALMAVMRKLNQITADRTVKPANALASDIQTLATLYKKAFGKAAKTGAADCTEAATAIRDKSPRETLQYLTALVSPGRPAAWSVPGDSDRGNMPFSV